MFPSQARKPSSAKSRNEEEGRLDTAVALEIMPGCAALDIPAHWYPFAPYVGGTTGSASITSSSSDAPGTFTPGGCSEHKSPGKRRTRTEQLGLEAPEKNLTLFAMRLAVLEKVASNVGTLAFIWATVVLLGGYAITLKEVDFWFVTVILVIEGARIFSRSHELELQHEGAGTALGSLFSRDALFRSTSAVISALTPGRQSLSNSSKVLDNPSAQTDEGNGNGGDQRYLTRTWSSSSVPLVPVFNWIFQAQHISRLLYCMQMVSAMVATALSIYRLITRNFTFPDETNTERNHNAALLIFYSLATLEAMVFLLERTYWEFQISVKKILVQVTKMCHLDIKTDLNTTRRFFYDVYSKCLTESIFEGLKMDIVGFALTWLLYDTPTEQLGGLRVLLKFCSREDMIAGDTLRSIGVKQGAVERLLEMVTWKNPLMHEIRKAASDLLAKLVKYNRYSVRVAAISGSIEGIFSLLLQDDDQTSGDGNFRQGASESLTTKIVETHIVGLRILKNLAKDPLNSAKIGATRGLLARLVSFIHTDEAMLRNPQAEDRDKYKIAMVKKSLELLNLLAGASGAPGKMLREEIAKIVFTISNLRNLLEYGQAHVMLQDVATEILSSLAMNDVVREMIGQTGGVMCSLLMLLMKKERVDGNGPQVQLARKAGVVLALLALNSKDNCLKMLRLKVCHGGLVVAADGEEGAKEAAAADGAENSHSGRDMVAALLELVPDWNVGHLAMIILRSLLAYSEGGHSWKVRIATSCTKQLLKLSEERSGRPQEAALGLLAKTVTELEAGQLKQLLEEDRLTPEALAARLAELLRRNPTPVTALPCLRRFCVELAVGLAERLPAAFLPAFRELNFCTLLHRVADSSTELENYAAFRGVVGVIPHSVTMSCLVDNAIHKLREKCPTRS